MVITPDLIAAAQAVESLQTIVPGVLFYTSRWYGLDNFSAYNVVYKEALYPTVEHAYQAMKFRYTAGRDGDEGVAVRERYAEMLRTAISPHEAKNLAHSDAFMPYIRTDWDQVKVWLMEQLLRAKHARHEHIRKTLRRTGNLIIVEDSPSDSFWGRGPDWQGQNHLGRLWMKIRDEQ